MRISLVQPVMSKVFIIILVLLVDLPAQPEFMFRFLFVMVHIFFFLCVTTLSFFPAAFVQLTVTEPHARLQNAVRLRSCRVSVPRPAAASVSVGAHWAHKLFILLQSLTWRGSQPGREFNQETLNLLLFKSVSVSVEQQVCLTWVMRLITSRWDLLLWAAGIQPSNNLPNFLVSQHSCPGFAAAFKSFLCV